MPISLDVVVKRESQCGEGPVWDHERGVVHWVDITGKSILTTDLATLVTTEIGYPDLVGAAAYRRDGGFVAAVATGFVAIDEVGQVSWRADFLTPDVRMNDAKTDPNGRYWAGSCAPGFTVGKGALWRLDGDGTVTQVLSGLTQPNGMGWSPDGTSFYLVETQARFVMQFGFDAETGTLRGAPVELIGAEYFPAGFPDGLAVDSTGNLWIAEYAGGAVHEFTPSGERVQSITVPTSYPTSCAFAGPNGDELWVTSAAAGADLEEEPLSGSMFRITGLGASAAPGVAFAGAL
jgi:sugar lactone lactonase YvrE